MQQILLKKIEETVEKSKVSENDVTEILINFLNLWLEILPISHQTIQNINKETFNFLSTLKNLQQKSSSNEKIFSFMEELPLTFSKILSTELVNVKSEIETKIQHNTKEILNQHLTSSERIINNRFEKNEILIENKLLNHSIANANKFDDKLNTAEKIHSTTKEEILKSTDSIKAYLDKFSSFLGTNHGKKELGEKYVENHVLNRFPRDITITKTSETARQTDYHLYTKEGLNISLEIKNWDRNVDYSETKKTRKIFAENSSLDVCIMVCLNQSIESHNELYFENVGGNRFIWFYPFAQQSNMDYLYPLVLMCNSVAPLIKLNISKTENSLEEYAKDIIGILKLIDNIKNINLHQDDLERVVAKQKIQINNLKSVLNDIITKFELSIEKLGGVKLLSETKNNLITELELKTKPKARKYQPKKRKQTE